MDKRFKSITTIEVHLNRYKVLETINQNPDWPIHIVAKFLRTECHLTLKDMSKLTKISPQAIQKLEQPNGNPTLNTIIKLFTTFGLKITIITEDQLPKR
ncbi:XRE family transcriptional regulator [Acinetobacter sp. WCHAc010034]|uniref:helix-turn-helix domain-containing protein n=1 Tax=Acinetobacter sp. WCHAc010034 TaxID=1879049 RepID=UPI00083AAA5E|nr:helix-turn-helix transcriptional regulator [Acinetobacter sp. WCHAc010034]AYA02724.1 XRE family transcriptional regulator [Acinetobacter sp. WCHAc010034]